MILLVRPTILSKFVLWVLKHPFSFSLYISFSLSLCTYIYINIDKISRYLRMMHPILKFSNTYYCMYTIIHFVFRLFLNLNLSLVQQVLRSLTRVSTPRRRATMETVREDIDDSRRCRGCATTRRRDAIVEGRMNMYTVVAIVAD